MQRSSASHPPPTSATLPLLQAKERAEMFLKSDSSVLLGPHEHCHRTNMQALTIPPAAPVSLILHRL